MGQNSATMPHFAAKEAGKCGLYYKYPGLQLTQQYSTKEEVRNVYFGIAGSLCNKDMGFFCLLYLWI